MSERLDRLKAIRAKLGGTGAQAHDAARPAPAAQPLAEGAAGRNDEPTAQAPRAALEAAAAAERAAAQSIAPPVGRLPSIPPPSATPKPNGNGVSPTLLKRITEIVAGAVKEEVGAAFASRGESASAAAGSAAKAETAAAEARAEVKALADRLESVDGEEGLLVSLGEGLDAHDKKFGEQEQRFGAVERRLVDLEKHPEPPSPESLRAMVKQVVEEQLRPIREKLDGIAQVIAEALKPYVARLESLEHANGASDTAVKRLEGEVHGLSEVLQTKEGELTGKIEQVSKAAEAQTAQASKAAADNLAAAIEEVDSRVDNHLDGFSSRLGDAEGKIGQLEDGMKGVKTQLDDPESGVMVRLGAQDEALEDLGRGLDELDERLKGVDGRVGEAEKHLLPDGVLDEIGARVDEAEGRVGKLESVQGVLERNRDEHAARLDALEGKSTEKSGAISSVGKQAQTTEERLAGALKRVDRVEEALTTMAGPDYETARGWRQLYMAPLTRLVAQAILSGDDHVKYVEHLQRAGYGKAAIKEVLQSLTLRETAEQEAATLGKSDDVQKLMDRAKECLGGA